MKYLSIVLFCFFSFESIGQNLSSHKLHRISQTAPNNTEMDAFDIVEYFKTKTNNPKKLVLLFVYWITQNISYDVDKYLSGDKTYTTVRETLETRKTLCQGYSELFYELCNYADIDCKIINGYAKGFDFNGKPFKDTNHIWNAVLIDNKWELVDVTWAMGFLSYRKGRLVFNKIFRGEYVFAKPDYFILTHYPTDSKWQLLNKPITADTFFGKKNERIEQDANKIDKQVKLEIDKLQKLIH